MKNRLFTYRLKIAQLVLFAVVLLICSQAVAEITDISASQARALIMERGSNPKFTILDLRTPPEFGQGHIQGALLIDYTSPEFKARLDRLDKTGSYMVYCRSGNRSRRALKTFADLGFTDIYHMNRGILQWKAEGYPLFP